MSDVYADAICKAPCDYEPKIFLAFLEQIWWLQTKLTVRNKQQTNKQTNIKSSKAANIYCHTNVKERSPVSVEVWGKNPMILTDNCVEYGGNEASVPHKHPGGLFAFVALELCAVTRIQKVRPTQQQPMADNEAWQPFTSARVNQLWREHLVLINKESQQQCHMWKWLYSLQQH